MSDIQLPQPEKISNIQSKMDELTLFEHINEFSGHDIIGEIFYFYLYHKYNANCLAVTRRGIHIVLCPGDQENIRCIRTAKNTDVIVNNICFCIANEIELLIIPISLIFRNSQSHANLLIYRRLYGTMEIFEPHGQDFMGVMDTSYLSLEQTQKEINKLYRLLISKINNQLVNINCIHRVVHLIKNKNVCPRYYGLQAIEETCEMKTLNEGGYCEAYCMFFTELVLMNPTKTSKELMKDIFVRLDKLDNPSQYLLQVIRGYVHVIKTIFETKLQIMLARDDISYDDFIQLCHKVNRTPEEHRFLKHILKINTRFLKSNVLFFHSKDEKEHLLERLGKSPSKRQQFLDFIRVSPSSSNSNNTSRKRSNSNTSQSPNAELNTLKKKSRKQGQHKTFKKRIPKIR